jgi:uncharacterized protein with von Willebrand factor type A (vWA) domain
METLLEHSTVCFLEKPYHEVDIVSLEETQHFGSCVVHVKERCLHNRPILFHFMIDISGSMSDITENNRTKMQLLIHTLKNMILYFANHCENVYIQVKGFDNVVDTYITKTLVCKSNVKSLLGQLELIIPRNMTNIETALACLKNDVSSENDLEQVAIFLTDGEITAGENDNEKLCSLIPEKVNFHAIALGHEHNPFLMYELGHATKWCNNWFINELEQTGNIYGEILYNELHKIAETVCLEVENGMLYDYNNNKFVSCLEIGSLSSETEKHYHLLSQNPDQCKVHIKGFSLLSNDTFEYSFNDVPPLLSASEVEEKVRFMFQESHFLNIQYCRMISQHYLAKARKMYFYNENLTKQMNQQNHSQVSLFKNMVKSSNVLSNDDEFREKVKSFMQYMNALKEEYQLETSESIQCLCDDLSLLLQTLGNNGQIKYCAMREDIQGQERTCNAVTMIPEEDSDFMSPGAIPRPVLSRSQTTPYRTPGRMNLMDTLSQDVDDDVIGHRLFIDTTQDNICGPPPPVLRRSQTQRLYE